MAVCEILCVGTELLLGDILNTNEQFLSKELAAMGISVMHRSSVGDNPERLAQELKTALGRSDIVITSGGLGPTDDDLTKEVCCEVMGFELREDEDTAERIRSYFKSKGGNMPKTTSSRRCCPSAAPCLRIITARLQARRSKRTASALLSCPALPASLLRCSTRACADS